MNAFSGPDMTLRWKSKARHGTMLLARRGAERSGHTLTADLVRCAVFSSEAEQCLIE